MHLRAPTRQCAVAKASPPSHYLQQHTTLDPLDAPSKQRDFRSNIRLRVSLAVAFLLGVVGGSFNKALFVQQPVVTSISQHLQAKQPESVSNCWQCIQPKWRRHFIFANATTGHLDVCPDSSSWPVGAWTAHAGQGRGSGTLQQQTYAQPAAVGEPAVLPATLMAQQAIQANQDRGDCKQAKFVVYRTDVRWVAARHTAAVALQG
jgi:hypothetical protein